MQFRENTLREEAKNELHNILNEKMEDVIKIVKSLEKWGLFIKGVIETIKNEAKEQKGGSLPISLRTLASCILRSALTERGVKQAGEGTIKAGENF